MNQKVRRYISSFSKKDESYAGEIQFKERITPSELRKLLNIQDHANELIDEYPIDKCCAKKIAPLLRGTLNLKDYDYFLSCDRLDHTDLENI